MIGLLEEFSSSDKKTEQDSNDDLLPASSFLLTVEPMASNRR